MVGAAAVAVAAAVFFGWRELHRSAYPDRIASSNGRLEAEQVDITSKLPGRIVQVLAQEGQMVDAGAVLVRLDATEIEAQLHAGEAQVRRAEQAITQAEHQVVLLESVRTLTRKDTIAIRP